VAASADRCFFLAHGFYPRGATVQRMRCTRPLTADSGGRTPHNDDDALILTCTAQPQPPIPMPFFDAGSQFLGF